VHHGGEGLGAAGGERDHSFAVLGRVPDRGGRKMIRNVFGDEMGREEENKTKN